MTGQQGIETNLSQQGHKVSDVITNLADFEAKMSSLDNNCIDALVVIGWLPLSDTSGYSEGDATKRVPHILGEFGQDSIVTIHVPIPMMTPRTHGARQLMEEGFNLALRAKDGLDVNFLRAARAVTELTRQSA
jgi:hypothetical protein